MNPWAHIGWKICSKKINVHVCTFIRELRVHGEARRTDLDPLLAFGEGRGRGGVVVWQVCGKVRTDFDHLYAFGGEGGGVVLWPIHGEVRRTDLDPWLAFGGGGGCCLASTWRGKDRLGSSACLWWGGLLSGKYMERQGQTWILCLPLVGGGGVVVWQVLGEARTDLDPLLAFGGGGLLSGKYMERQGQTWILCLPLVRGRGGGCCCLASAWRGEEDRLGSGA